MERLVRGFEGLRRSKDRRNYQVLFRFLLVLFLGGVVMIGRLLRSIASLLVSVRGMTVRLIGFMAGLLVLAFFVQFGRLIVMFRRTTVVFCCGRMMLSSRMFIICHCFLLEIYNLNRVSYNAIWCGKQGGLRFMRKRSSTT
jgi:hypothetical protein